MGWKTDVRTDAWRRAAGIEIPIQDVCALWRELQAQGVEMIKVAELEVSGIRDGDGCWHGSDVVGATLNELTSIIDRLRRAYGMDPLTVGHVDPSDSNSPYRLPG